MSDIPTSQYHGFLPAVLQEDILLRQFLLGFEQILTGFETDNKAATIVHRDQPDPPGLENILDNIHLYFNPQETPSEFLPWLAGWVGLSLRDDWDVRVKREFIRQVIALYQIRGTKIGLEKVLALYLKNSGFGDKVKVFEHFEHLPYYFQVQLTLPDRDPDKYWRQARIAKAIIDQEKPAHTYYTLKILVPTMQITKDVHQSFRFTLIPPPDNQLYSLRITIIPDINSPEQDISWLAKQLKIFLDNQVETITYSPQEIITHEQNFQAIFKINYQQFLASLDGFKITLSNQTDARFLGAIAVAVTFSLNGQRVTNQILNQALDLPPALRIINAENQEGSSAIYLDREPPGMFIPESMESSPLTFRLFDDPEQQIFIIDVQIIVESAQEVVKQDDEEINQAVTITRNLMFKLGATIRDNNSEGHLLNLPTNIEGNTITIQKVVTHQQYVDNSLGYRLHLKNLNLQQLSGRILVDVSLNLNQTTITHRILNTEFSLAALGEYDRLQICQRYETGKIVSGNTILGTTSQAF